MKEFYVRISGWQTGRCILVEDSRVLFEVAEADGCSICLSRIRHVRSVLTAKHITPVFETRRTGYGPTEFVVLPPAPSGVDVKHYVRDTLEIPIVG